MYRTYSKPLMREEPHEGEVVRHAHGQAMLQVERAVEPVGKEVKQRDAADAHVVDVVGPVDQQAAPDHDGQHREVDPVHPANRSRVFRLQAVHDFSSTAVPGALTYPLPLGLGERVG